MIGSGSATPDVSSTIATVADLFTQHWPSSAALYLAGGALLVAGSLVLHFHRVTEISRQVGGGLTGLPVLVIGLLCAPNAAVAGAAYADGAIKAVAPKFSDFDFYADLLFPGGVAAEQMNTPGIPRSPSRATAAAAHRAAERSGRCGAATWRALGAVGTG